MLLWHATMSLDGFIAAPGHRVEGVFRHAGPNPEAGAVLQSTGAILCGRNAFEAAARAGFEGPFAGADRVPVFVLTNRPLDDAPAGVTTLHGDIHEAVAAAQEAAGGRDVLVLGAEAARECLDAGLLDEVLVHVAPVLLGDGVRLVGRPGVGQVELEPLSVTRAGAVTNLRFRVIGPLP